SVRPAPRARAARAGSELRAASERTQWLPTMCRQQFRGQSSQTSRPPLRKRKGVTLAYSVEQTPKTCVALRAFVLSGLHEHRHHLVSKEHSLAGQVKTRAVAPKATGLDERLEVGPIPAPDVDAVASLYGIYV